MGMMPTSELRVRFGVLVLFSLGELGMCEIISWRQGWRLQERVNRRSHVLKCNLANKTGGCCQLEVGERIRPPMIEESTRYRLYTTCYGYTRRECILTE